MPRELTSSILRDTLFIWIFATAREETLDGIKNKTISGKDLLIMLEDTGAITAGDADNKKTCNEVCAKILANADEFTAIRDIWAHITVLFRFWTGSGLHPILEELQAIFIPLSAQAIRNSNQIRMKRRGRK